MASDVPYIFWLALHRRQPFQQFKLICCEITHNHICFQANKREVLPIADIRVCEQYRTSNDKYSGPLHVHIQMKLPPYQDYYWGVAGPLFRNWDKVEITNFVTIVNRLMQNQEIDLHPNPYYRMFERYGKLAYFVEKDWIPSTSPEIYKDRLVLHKIRADIAFDRTRFMWLLFIPASILSIVIGQRELDGAVAMMILTCVLTLPVIGFSYWRKLYKTKLYLQEEADPTATRAN